MNPLDYRFVLNIKNYIKKSISATLLGVMQCGSISDEAMWGLPSLSMDSSRDAIQVKPTRNLKEPAFEESALDEHVISQLFVGFFNNKMTLPVFLIQSSGTAQNAKLVGSALAFLDDIYRHMLTKEQQCRCRLIFKWLKLFFKKLPSVSYEQRQKALMFIYEIYFTLGMQPKFNVGGKK